MGQAEPKSEYESLISRLATFSEVLPRDVFALAGSGAAATLRTGAPGEAWKQTFDRWLALHLGEQRMDLDAYIAQTDGSQPHLWPAHYENFPPDSATEPEVRLFRCDLTANLAVIRADRDLTQKERPSAWRVRVLLDAALRARGSVGLSLKDSCQRLRISENYLAVIFKEVAGVGFRQWLRSVRIAESADLLVAGTNSVGEVAASVGYREAGNFVREFRTELGIPPGEFRSFRLAKPGICRAAAAVAAGA